MKRNTSTGFTQRWESFYRNEAINTILSNKIISTDFANYFLGNYIGCGISRYVFEHPDNKNWVYKIDASEYNANVLEFDVWSRVQHVKNVSKWFAPCGKMSRCGRIMLQRRCKPLTDYPKIIPHFLTDIKPDNFGLLDGRVVCFDYAGNLLMENGMSLKMKKANWYGV